MFIFTNQARSKGTKRWDSGVILPTLPPLLLLRWAMPLKAARVGTGSGRWHRRRWGDQETFSESPEQLAQVRKKLDMESHDFGLHLPSEHRVFRLDSANVPLWQWHNDGIIDLYAMAGLLSFDSFQVIRLLTSVKSVTEDGNDSLLPVNRWTISHYIQSQGRDGRIRVYAVSDQVLADKLQVAETKCRRMAVKLEWNNGTTFSWFRNYTPYGLTTLEEFQTKKDGLSTYLLNHDLRKPGVFSECTLLALSAFHIRGADGSDHFGWTVGRDIAQGPAGENCPASPGRNDSCCNTASKDSASCVIHRDVHQPDLFMRYILAHEIGHYLGLCHFGHNGIQNIMFTPARDPGHPENETDYTSWGLWRYGFEREPNFTLDDARNTWRFLVSGLRMCLLPQDISIP
jgi:hypothetical protein